MARLILVIFVFISGVQYQPNKLLSQDIEPLAGSYTFQDPSLTIRYPSGWLVFPFSVDGNSSPPDAIRLYSSREFHGSSYPRLENPEGTLAIIYGPRHFQRWGDNLELTVRELFTDTEMTFGTPISSTTMMDDSSSKNLSYISGTTDDFLTLIVSVDFGNNVGFYVMAFSNLPSNEFESTIWQIVRSASLSQGATSASSSNLCQTSSVATSNFETFQEPESGFTLNFPQGWTAELSPPTLQLYNDSELFQQLDFSDLDNFPAGLISMNAGTFLYRTETPAEEAEIQLGDRKGLCVVGQYEQTELTYMFVKLYPSEIYGHADYEMEFVAIGHRQDLERYKSTLLAIAGSMRISEEETPSTDTVSAVQKTWCSDTLPSYLSVDLRGQVANVEGGTVRLRSGPGTNNSILMEMEAGTTFTVIGGPECGSYTWWQLRLADGTVGWAAEGADGEYWIEPVGNPAETIRSSDIQSDIIGEWEDFYPHDPDLSSSQGFGFWPDGSLTGWFPLGNIIEGSTYRLISSNELILDTYVASEATGLYGADPHNVRTLEIRFVEDVLVLTDEYGNDMYFRRVSDVPFREVLPSIPETISLPDSCTINVAVGDFSALIAAIDLANSEPSADMICLEPGVYDLPQMIEPEERQRLENPYIVLNGLPLITSNISIVGVEAENTIITGEEELMRIFKVAQTGRLTLSHITIQNGSAGTSGGMGGSILNYGYLEVTDSVILSNGADFGGGIYNAGGTVTIENSVISDNTARRQGGGIYNDNGTVTISASLIRNNSTGVGIMNDGGALANIGGVVSITNSCIVDNSLPSVYNETGSPQIDAVNNWWGTNQPGSNSLVSGDVTFMPVSTQDNCGKAIGVPDEFVTVFVPPYELCRNTSSSSDVTLPIEFENFIQGFNYTESNCSFNEGTLSHRIMVWGGSEGNILRPAGSREAFASNFIEVEYIPSVTGMIEIEANVVVNANVAAAAGSASIFPDVNDALSIVADLPTMLGNFITVAEGLTTASFGGIKSEAYMTVDVGDSVNETVQTIGGHGFVSSFPIPPYTQSESFTSERIILLITSPATQGEPIYIRVGVRTEAKATGWAGAHWNLRGQDSIIESINIRPQG